MLKQGKSILSFIRTESKISSEKITDIQHQANDLVYKNNMCYITPYTADTLFNQFVSLGTELSKERVTDKQRQKKEEVLESLRNNCKALKQYKSAKLTVDDIPICQKVMKYQLYKYLEAKRNNTLSDSVIFDFLHSNKDIMDNMIKPLQAIKDDAFTEKELKNYCDMNREILNTLFQRYNYEQEN